MSEVKHTVVVEFDQSLHPKVDPAKLGESEMLAFAALDTVWNLLNEYAARVTLASLREEMREEGYELPSDQELFRRSVERSGPDGVSSYRDLASSDPVVPFLLHDAFQRLVINAMSMAEEAMGGAE